MTKRRIKKGPNKRRGRESLSERKLLVLFSIHKLVFNKGLPSSFFTARCVSSFLFP